MSFKQLSVDKVVVKKGLNFRTKFDSKEIDKLATSINNVGLLQPIVVSTNGMLIAGECRLRAMKKLKRKKIDAQVLRVEDEETAKEMNAAENIHRSTLGKGEESRACAYLRDRWVEAGGSKKGGRPTKTTDAKTKTTDKMAKGKKPPHDEKVSKSKPKLDDKVKETGMSRASFNRKAKVGDSASAKVIAALDSGDVSQKQAEQLADLPKKKQDELLPKMKGKSAAQVMTMIGNALPPAKKKEKKAREEKAATKKVEPKQKKNSKDNQDFDGWIVELSCELDTAWRKLKIMSGKSKQVDKADPKVLKSLKGSIVKCQTHLGDVLGML